MSDRIQIGQLQIHSVLHDLIANEIAPGTGVDPQQFWVDFEKILTEFMPRNKLLLAFRDELQEKIDTWHLNVQVSRLTKSSTPHFQRHWLYS